MIVMTHELEACKGNDDSMILVMIIVVAEQLQAGGRASGRGSSTEAGGRLASQRADRGAQRHRLCWMDEGTAEVDLACRARCALYRDAP